MDVDAATDLDGDAIAADSIADVAAATVLEGQITSLTEPVIERLYLELPRRGVGVREVPLGWDGPWDLVFETIGYTSQWESLGYAYVTVTVSKLIQSTADNLDITDRTERNQYKGVIHSIDYGTPTTLGEITPITVTLRCNQIGRGMGTGTNIKEATEYYSIPDNMVRINGKEVFTSLGKRIRDATPDATA